MPRRELKHPDQVGAWLDSWGRRLRNPARMILIGSGALLWHAGQKGLLAPLDENSMDVDPVTEDEELVELCYEALIGSDFELEHGWHVNLMPREVMREFPEDWPGRASRADYHLLNLVVPSVQDLMVPKLKRGEPRDHKHHAWAVRTGLLSGN